jgi:hypothetical protein
MRARKVLYHLSLDHVLLFMLPTLAGKTEEQASIFSLFL